MRIHEKLHEFPVHNLTIFHMNGISLKVNSLLDEGRIRIKLYLYRKDIFRNEWIKLIQIWNFIAVERFGRDL